jgi:hypothetical protein
MVFLQIIHTASNSFVSAIDVTASGSAIVAKSPSTLSSRFPANLIESRPARSRLVRNRTPLQARCRLFRLLRQPNSRLLPQAPQHPAKHNDRSVHAASRPAWHRALRRHPEFGGRHCPFHAGKRRNTKEYLCLANNNFVRGRQRHSDVHAFRLSNRAITFENRFLFLETEH